MISKPIELMAVNVVIFARAPRWTTLISTSTCKPASLASVSRGGMPVHPFKATSAKVVQRFAVHLAASKPGVRNRLFLSGAEYRVSSTNSCAQPTRPVSASLPPEPGARVRVSEKLIILQARVHELKRNQSHFQRQLPFSASSNWPIPFPPLLLGLNL